MVALSSVRWLSLYVGVVAIGGCITGSSDSSADSVVVFGSGVDFATADGLLVYLIWSDLSEDNSELVMDGMSLGRDGVTFSAERRALSNVGSIRWKAAAVSNHRGQIEINGRKFWLDEGRIFVVNTADETSTQIRQLKYDTRGIPSSQRRWEELSKSIPEVSELIKSTAQRGLGVQKVVRPKSEPDSEVE